MAHLPDDCKQPPRRDGASRHHEHGLLMVISATSIMQTKERDARGHEHRELESGSPVENLPSSSPVNMQQQIHARTWAL